MSIFGVLELGGAEIALSLDTLREVIPRPASFEPLPVKARGLLGAVVLRELVIPIVDVRVFVGLEQEHSEGQVIAILRHDGHLIGLLADGVNGLREFDADEQLVMRPGPGGPLIFSGCFQPNDGEPLISVIDVRTVFGLPGVPAVREPDVVALEADVPGDAMAEARRVLMLVRCGTTPLAFDVEHVRSVLPTIDLTPSVLQSELCHGVTDYLGVTIPVADLLSLLGLGRFGADDAGQGIVLVTERGFVALLVTDIVEIVQLPVSAIKPLPRFGLPRAEYFAGVCEPGNGEHFLVLDTDALRHDHELSVLGSLNLHPEQDEVADRDGATGGSAGGQSYLVYAAGTDVVTELAEISEIIAMPDTLLETNSRSDGILGLTTHRSAVVPVVDLELLLGRGGSAPAADRRLLLVGPPGAQVAFAVPGLYSIETSLWEEPAKATTHAATTSLLVNAPLVRVPSADATGTRLLPRVSLLAVLAALTPNSLDSADSPVDGSVEDSGSLMALTAA